MTHVVLVLGIALVGLGFARMYPYFRSRNWVTRTARVVSTSELSAEVWLTYNARIKYLFPVVEYEYESRGDLLRSNRVSFEKKNVWVPEVDSWGNPTDKTKVPWASWSQNLTIPIYVNPGNPTESVIVRDLSKKRRSHHLAFITGGALLLLIWAALQIAV